MQGNKKWLSFHQILITGELYMITIKLKKIYPHQNKPRPYHQWEPAVLNIDISEISHGNRYILNGEIHEIRFMDENQNFYEGSWFL